MFIIIYMLFLDPSPAPPLFTNGVLGRKRSGHGWSEGELVSFVSSCMTIATRLILCRRSRPSRPHDNDVESGPTSSLPRRRHHHRDELEVSPRSAHHGRFPSRRSSHSVFSDQWSLRCFFDSVCQILKNLCFSWSLISLFLLECLFLCEIIWCKRIYCYCCPFHLIFSDLLLFLATSIFKGFESNDLVVVFFSFFFPHKSWNPSLYKIIGCQSHCTDSQLSLSTSLFHCAQIPKMGFFFFQKKKEEHND